MVATSVGQEKTPICSQANSLYEQDPLRIWRTTTLEEAVPLGLLVARSVGPSFQYNTGQEAKPGGCDKVWRGDLQAIHAGSLLCGVRRDSRTPTPSPGDTVWAMAVLQRVSSNHPQEKAGMNSLLVGGPGWLPSTILNGLCFLPRCWVAACQSLEISR